MFSKQNKSFQLFPQNPHSLTTYPTGSRDYQNIPMYYFGYTTPVLDIYHIFPSIGKIFPSSSSIGRRWKEDAACWVCDKRVRILRKQLEQLILTHFD